MDSCFLPEGVYHLRILRPKGIPEYQITFELIKGVYQAQVITEHGAQRVQSLTLGHKKISWQQFGGTLGKECFQYEMEIFPEGLLMGSCRRIDVPEEEAPLSPVIAETEKGLGPI